MLNILNHPILTRRRIWLAMTVAVVADGLQWLLGPFGWWFFDEVIDVLAMVLTSVLLGFHWLLLPTFVLECIPIVDWLPTWTGCVALLISMRKKKDLKQLRPLKEISASENSNLSQN